MRLYKKLLYSLVPSRPLDKRRKICALLIVGCVFLSLIIGFYLFQFVPSCEDPFETPLELPGCPPKSYSLNGTRDVRVSKWYQVPLLIWESVFFHRGEALHIAFLGPSGQRGWTGRANWGQPVPGDISETSYIFFCLYPDTGVRVPGTVVTDPHHNSFIVTCSVPPEEIPKYDAAVGVSVILHDETHRGMSPPIKVCKLSTQKYKLTACTMVHNEAKFIPQWIEYLLLVGVEHFFIYNHASTDNLLKALRPYTEANIVTVVQWSYDHKKYNAQTVHLNSCIYRFRDFSEWQLHMDIDEYLYPVHSSSIIPHLDDFLAQDRTLGSVTFDQYQFGADNDMLDQGYTLMESAIHRAEKSRRSAPKPAVYVQNVQTVSVHMITSGGPNYDADFETLRFHHFWRGQRGTRESINKVEDKAMLGRFGDKVRNQLTRRYQHYVTNKRAIL